MNFKICSFRIVAMIFCLSILCGQAISQKQTAETKGNPDIEKGGPPHVY
jgi:hypothetical protein